MKGCGDVDRGGDCNNHQQEQLGAAEMAWWLKHSSVRTEVWIPRKPYEYWVCAVACL